jgi:hypothetical protein
MGCETFFSLHYQLENTKVEYGLLQWQSTYEINQYSRRSHSSASSGHTYENVKFSLIETVRDRCEVADLSVRFSDLSNGVLILDELPETNTLKKMLKSCQVKTVKREGLSQH